MPISNDLFTYLAQWVAEGMEKAHEEMRKADPKAFKNPLRGLGKGAFKFFSNIDAMLCDLFERRLCMSKEKPLLMSEDLQTLYAYNGERFEQITIRTDTFIAELAKRTLRELEIGSMYVQKSPRSMASAVIGTLTSTEEYIYKAERRYIAFSNGVFDLDTRKLKAFSPQYNPYLTLDIEYMTSDEAYRRGSNEYGTFGNPCNLWKAKLKEILPLPDFQAAFQQWCGSLLLDPEKFVREYVCYITGSGANGKSVLANVISQVFGERYFSHFTPRQLFKDSDRGANIASLRGKLANMVDDLNDKDISGGDYKRFASGQAFEARIPYEKRPITVYAPPMLCCTNEMPEQRDFSNGGMRRQLIIRSRDESLAPEKQDPELATKLTCPIGRAYIFNWIVEGYRAVIKNNGKIELGAEVVKAMNMVANNSSNLRRWWSENNYVEVAQPERADPRWRTLKSLWEEYQKFCIDEGSRKRDKRDLSQFLRNKDFEMKRNIRTVTGNVQYCIGKLDYDTTEQGELICGVYKS